MPKQGRHSAEAIELVKKFIEKLKEIPDGDGEMFPYNTIEELQKEYNDQS